jgi:hypothetical protein
VIPPNVEEAIASRQIRINGCNKQNEDCEPKDPDAISWQVWGRNPHEKLHYRRFLSLAKAVDCAVQYLARKAAKKGKEVAAVAAPEIITAGAETPDDEPSPCWGQCPECSAFIPVDVDETTKRFVYHGGMTLGTRCPGSRKEYTGEIFTYWQTPQGREEAAQKGQEAE